MAREIKKKKNMVSLMDVLAVIPVYTFNSARRVLFCLAPSWLCTALVHKINFLSQTLSRCERDKLTKLPPKKDMQV